MRQDRGTSSQQAAGHQRAIHDATIVALSIGSGIGVHFAGNSGPFVASAGVLAAALVSRHAYGAEIRQVRSEVQDLQARMQTLSDQVEADRERDTRRMGWVAQVSHEIRSPLSAVVALGDMLMDSTLGTEQAALVKDIQEAGHMVLGVVNDTLDLSKAESGRLVLVARPFSLNALCERVARMGQALATGNRRSVQVRTAPAPVDRVVGDELRLQQVLLNLVSNAVKFSNSGVVEIACTRRDDPSDDAVLLRFSVSDHGPGLSPTEQSQLFTPYTRLTGNDRGTEGGTGLGLYLCQQIVGLMGGSIGVSSQPGQGSQFWFTAPLGLQADPGLTEAAAGAVRPSPGATRERQLEHRQIAVVDDARMSREVAERIIRTAGGRCLVFASAEAFLDHLRAERPHLDAVLMDLELPGMDGFTACEQMRQFEGLQAVPVVAVTGTEAGLVATELKRSGLQGHLLKPFHAASLVATIVALLDLATGP